MKNKLVLFSILYFQIMSLNGQAPGNALSFDGAGAYVYSWLPAIFNNAGSNDFTIETWVKPEGSGIQRIFFAQLSPTQLVSILLNGDNVPYVFVYDTAIQQSATTDSSLVSGKWTHLAMTWEAATQTIDIYIKGILQATVPGGISTTGTNYIMTLGSKTDATQFFRGEMDEFRIWGKKRSQCEIATAMNSEFTVPQTDLIVCYNFNQGVAGGTNTGITTLPDLLMSHDGTLISFGLSGSGSNWVNSAAVITLINQGSASSYITDIQTACDSFTWMDGITYTSNNNTATDTLTNAGGCDSIIALDLTLLNRQTIIETHTACDSFIWIDGNTYTANNNTATYAIATSAGCDSLLNLDLTISKSTAGTDVQTACRYYTWIDGNTYTTSNNNAMYILTNAEGCDSLLTLDLTIDTVNVSVTNNSPTLKANATNAVYQWVNCDNGYAPIIGEADQFFTANSNGNYAVIITESGCTDTSDCYSIINSAISNKPAINPAVYPNPGSGKFNIDLGANYDEVTITIKNTLGQTVSPIKHTKFLKNIRFEIIGKKGIYFLEIRIRESYFMVVKVVKS